MALAFLEKDLEDIIYETPPDDLVNRGLFMIPYHGIFRQLDLGSYGVADLVTFRIFGRIIQIQIFELKQKVVTGSAFFQALRYGKGISKLLRQYDLNNHEISYHFCLIGNSVDLKSDFCYTVDFVTCMSLYTYEYRFDGIHFEKQEGFHLLNPQRNAPMPNKDYLKAGIKSSLKERAEYIDSLNLLSF